MKFDPDQLPKDEPCWFCVRTQPKHEALAAQFLRHQVGVEVFSPLLRFQRVTRRGKKWFQEALFPCYVFSRFDFWSQYRHVAAALGVTKIVGFGGGPAIVPQQVIDELRCHVHDEQTIEIAHELAPGDEVTVLDGPFKGLRAVVTRVMPARDRVAVLLDLLGTMREVELTTGRVIGDKVHPLRTRTG